MCEEFFIPLTDNEECEDMELPKDFCELMRQQYGDEVAGNLFEGLSQEPVVSIRLNPKKACQILSAGDELSTVNCQLSISDKVAWCPDAYYLNQRPAFTFDPLFHAGVYYVQEASSMYLAEVLRRYAPLGNMPANGFALDLCAAPGGKSTLLRSLLPEEWVLVSNEPMAKRAQVLAENMTKWGHPHSIVTQNYPADFTFLSSQFDVIVTDVPCSGEGMFRKDEQAIREWSLENVQTCWQRQRGILTDIWPTLKAGGLLIYSTCTFNHFEDEDNVQWIASHLGAEVLEQRHFLPGRDAGEGFFIAALRKHGTPENDNASTLSADAFCAKLHRNLRVLLDGIPQAEQTPKGPVPSHVLAMSTTYERGSYPECELTYEQALAYLRREALRIEAPKGIILVTFKGIPLGFAKSIGNRANNLYPQEWRIRTTYTTPFCLAN